ncbi:CRISPR-associated endonuclease/helicase Cas3 [Marinitoga hydrogenitolerans DSM 16785]|uniref:CRISPR-associated endonuclease/helicase Cas3 n=1 Tax=Marinitoga hydrogenitolerans (strain DSM 16785 / JCM 12826 / AT1271) TaxID=1122195 RepID=A0A1M4Z449_MARH1|nr:CRISPR-associated helicase/endonuclease Cas3 [Marinitoga hydrogenitolerans]SHF12790.1 CRISPR-associated endonuclease/helicase Cas3 [Marinitoga hydrogenitolerans DSM 16785]
MCFLAKSNPEETIQEHTDKLLNQLEKLKKTYPSIDVNWDLLRYACLYHDIGKINIYFQEKLKNNKRNSKEIPHSLLSILFLDPEELSNYFDDSDIQILYQAIAYHHERDFSEYLNGTIEEEYDNLREQLKKFNYDKLPNLKLSDYIDDYYFSLGDRIYKENQELFKKYVLTKGFLNRIDYAASAGVDVEIKNDFLIENLNQLGYTWNDLQKFMIQHREENVIAVAQTGMGKTEAGLLWIGNKKGFYTLPLKVAINAIYDRITEKILKGNNINKVGILHSDTYSEYLKREKNFDDIDINYYFSATRQFSLALTVTTLDQLFDIVYGYKGFEIKLATLSYSKIVLDEVQMYSPDLLAYLIIGLKIITKFGGKFSILTATLPNILIDELKKQKINFIMPQKEFINDEIRHSMKVIKEKINAEFIYKKYNNQRILVICNTVKQAQELYLELLNIGIEKSEINLLHSKFIKKDREKKEIEIQKMGNNYNSKGIWISTQIVEASLDIDFDLLITELSDLNSLFQRMGRVYRKRYWKEEGYNIYVFIGDENEKCSGVGNVIDKDIFELSKNKVKSIDGILTEEEKIKLINSTYTYDNLKNTKYYNVLKTTLDYVNTFDLYELEKKEVRKRFRNIDNTLIIPEPIFNENKNIIEKLINEYNDSIKDKKEKYLIKNEILKYTTTILFRTLNKIGEVKINKHEKIFIHKCNYSCEVGITELKDIKNENKKFDNIF